MIARWDSPRRAAACGGLIACLLLAGLPGCSWLQESRRPLLKEYRLARPERQLVQPIWLATYTTDELWGKLSADGRQLLYAGSQKGNLDIWIKDLTTGVPRRLTKHVATDTQPSWSPDGKQVVFVSMRADVKGDIYLWEDGKLSALTDRAAGESFPVFAPDGAAIYFASGPEGQTRIERLTLASRQRQPITTWGASHPAPSPDGRYLAFTLFDAQQRGRLAVMELAQKKVTLLSTPDFHTGFPAFAPDGRELYFVRFDLGQPGQPLETDASGRLFRLDLPLALQQPDPATVMALATPITSGRSSALFPAPTSEGVVFTSKRAGSLDIGLLPRSGPVPRLPAAGDQLALAAAQEHPRDELLCLQAVEQHGHTREASLARYRAATLSRELGEFYQARLLLEGLDAGGSALHGEQALLARIDLALLEVERLQQEAETGGPALPAAALATARQRLETLELPPAPGPTVAAHMLLRQGDILRLAGQDQQATAVYERLLQEHPQERSIAAEARFQLAGLFSLVREPDLLARYYLSLFADFPDQTPWLRRAAKQVLALQRSAEAHQLPAPEAERLRSLIEAHRDKPLFCALALARLAELYEHAGEAELAIEALHALATRHRDLPRESTAAGFELGRLSLAYSETLRQRGRFSDALGFYDKALGAYSQILSSYEGGHEHHLRARAEFLRLSLLQAAQLEQEGELALAEKRYHQMLEVDPDALQAHRKLIQLGVASRRRAELRQRYAARLQQDAGDAVAHYGLGYLATFREPLDEQALDEAQAHLQRAVELNPQTPFGHLTLGWINEMRERALGQTYRGWLEEAILLYERAHSLNDARIDVQTEADLLLNLCNAFAHLGNGWEQAYDFCEQRQRLKLPFANPLSEAGYHLTFGRAATATGHYALANQQLSRALELARDLDKKKLEAEVVARLALNAHLRGEYGASNRYLRQAAKHYEAQGQTEVLGGLARSEAYNLTLAGRHGAALEQLARASALIEKHSTPELGEWSPIGGPGRTTAPFGFDRLDEARAALGIKGLIYHSKQAWPELLPLLQARLANRKAAHDQRGDEELQREALQVGNHLALTQLQLGHEQGAQEALEAAIALATTLQTDPERGLVPTADTFPLQLGLALNAAEALLAELPLGRGDDAALSRQLQRLRQLEQARAAVEEREKDPAVLLPERLRLSLFSDLALLEFHAGLRGLNPPETAPASAGSPSAAPAAPPTTKEQQATAAQEQKTAHGQTAAQHAAAQQAENKPAAKTGPRAAAVSGQPEHAEQALAALLARGAPLTRAITLQRKLLAATDPSLPVPENLWEKRAAAEERGTLAPLWQPLSALDRLRWHVQAGLNLALTGTALTPLEQLADHPSSALLQELAALCLQHELGALRFVVVAELAYRRADSTAMAAAVEGFLARSPLLLDASYFSQAALMRRHVFSRAIELALRQEDLALALALSEREERRAFADDLAAAPVAGSALAQAPLKELMAATQAYRRQLAAQQPEATEKKRHAWRQRLDGLEQGVQQKLAALAAAAPRVAALFEVPAFPQQALLEALRPDDVLVTALSHGEQVLLVSLLPGTAPASLPLEVPRSELLAELARDPAAARARLAPLLSQLTRGARRVHLDLGRLSPELRPEELLSDKEVIRLATLWELLDARQVQTVALPGGVVAHPELPRAQELAGQLQLTAIGGDALTPARLALPFEHAAALVWAGPLRFDGGRATNARLLLHDPQGTRLEDLRLDQHLGQPLRGDLLLLAEVRHTPGKQRAEQVALARLVHAMGVPSLLLVQAPTTAQIAPPAAPFAPALIQALAARQQLGLTAALAKADSAARPALFGHPGLSPAEAKTLAEKELKARVFAGAGAFNARRLPEAVRELEVALRLMTYLQDTTYLDGTLLYLGNSYTLLEDFARAVPKMERLVALRAEAVAKAKAENKDPLQAQANWVQALQTMGWLRLRNEQHDQALAVNAQAIALYQEVKRPLMAQPALAQRSIIAEKKGDMPQALKYAQRSLETAQQALAASPQNATAAGTVVEEALRLATLQRERFSAYGEASAAVRTALQQIPKVDPASLGQLQARAERLGQQAGAAKEKEKESLQKQLQALQAEQAQKKSALQQQLAALLELARINSARGDYLQATGEAERALSLAEQGGLAQDTPLLEVVNNLYYLKRYGQALQMVDRGLAQAGENPLRRIQFFNAKGTVYGALGRTEEALQVLGQALALARKLNHVGELANTINNLGNTNYLAGRFAEAKAQFEQAIEIDRAQKNQLGLAFDYANLGLAELQLKRGRAAREHLQQALQLSQQIGAPLNELKARYGLGQLQLQAGQAQGALEHYQAGLTLAEGLGLRLWSWRFRLLAGRALRELKRPADATRELKRALAIVEELPPRQPLALGAPKVEEEPEDVYDELIDLLAGAGQGDAALELLERLRARSLIDRLSQSTTKLPLAAGRQLLERISELQQTLEAARSAQLRASKAPDKAAAAAEVQRLQQELHSTKEALGALNPQLPGLMAIDTWPLAQLKQKLPTDPSTQLISYYPGQKRLWIWSWQRGGFLLKAVAVPRARLTAAVERLRSGLTNFHDVSELSQQLYRWLLAPVLGGEGPPAPDRPPQPRQPISALVLVPQGPLSVLPFAALHDGQEVLIARRSLHYLPSLNTLRFAADQEQAPPQRSLSLSWAGAEQPAPLSFAPREAEAFARSFPQTQLLHGAQASRQAFFAQAPAADLIHLATHGEYQPEAPLLSHLQLFDGKLTLLEVLGLKLRASLVVLSACETGLGQLDGADSIVGLHRAFMAAGARRVVSTLWRVSDLGAALLMKHFFRQLAASPTDPAGALQRAQNQLRARFPHPAFWAGFRLDGAL